MKTRLLHVGNAVLIATLFLLLLFIVVAAATLATARAEVPAGEIVTQTDGPTDIVAGRKISIPFGIHSTLTLTNDGNQVTVDGPGDCDADAEFFKVRAWVTQPGVPARATNQTTWRCSNAANWQVVVTAPPPFAFEPGPAEVCGMVIIETSEGGNDVSQWCQDVTLVSAR